MNDQTAQPQVPIEPPAIANPGMSADPTPNSAPPSTNNADASESLADQNIFVLLGVNDGTTEQREEFLDELQQVIWEDFLEFDAKLLITKEEYQELQEILSQQESGSLEQQEAVVVYLEKLVPELEAIMMEKALELKADLVRERIAGMKEFYAGNAEGMQKLQRADELIMQERWRSCAELLNTIS